MHLLLVGLLVDLLLGRFLNSLQAILELTHHQELVQSQTFWFLPQAALAQLRTIPRLAP